MNKLTVNGREHAVDADPATPILWALRDTLGMTELAAPTPCLPS